MYYYVLMTAHLGMARIAEMRCPEFDVKFRIETILQRALDCKCSETVDMVQANPKPEWGQTMYWLIVVMTNLVLLVTPVTESAKVPLAWDAKTIVWQKVDSDGTRWSVLEGRSDVAGEAFTYAAFIPAGFHDFHSHATDARVAVVQGILKVSFGETLDLEHLKSYAVGSFLFVPADVKHTMAADENTIIIGTAVGPWHTHHPELQHHH